MTTTLPPSPSAIKRNLEAETDQDFLPAVARAIQSITHGSVSDVAAILGVSEKTVYQWGDPHTGKAIPLRKLGVLLKAAPMWMGEDAEVVGPIRAMAHVFGYRTIDDDGFEAEVTEALEVHHSMFRLMNRDELRAKTEAARDKRRRYEKQKALRFEDSTGTVPVTNEAGEDIAQA